MSMLMTNPNIQATMQEVMSHPWMIQNFAGPLAIHMVPQEPLQADELEQDVICGMTGFEFGTEDDIENCLTDILLSEPYCHHCHMAHQVQVDNRSQHQIHECKPQPCTCWSFGRQLLGLLPPQLGCYCWFWPCFVSPEPTTHWVCHFHHCTWVLQHACLY